MKLIIDNEFQILGLVSKDNDLPTITASLFQSPGGRKFLEFMNPFVRYVVIHYMKVWDARKRYSVIISKDWSYMK